MAQVALGQERDIPVYRPGIQATAGETVKTGGAVDMTFIRLLPKLSVVSVVRAKPHLQTGSPVNSHTCACMHAHVCPCPEP